MKIGYLGMGTWGFTLASLLASKGHTLICWTTKPDLAAKLTETRVHPLLEGAPSEGAMTFTTSIESALSDAEVLVESVTSAGLRPVLERVANVGVPSCPLILTSKGIEQDSHKILSEVVVELFGEKFRPLIGALSGPSYASEVVKGLPTSVTGSGYSDKTIQMVCELFRTDRFRVYPNQDIRGVAFGGALKNIIAIACGICEGLGLGLSARSALITRGLHEMRKLAVANGCQPETLNGLTGLGDLVLTCSSMTSRNFRFGHLLAEGFDPKTAQEKIGMVVEGAYTVKSAIQLCEDQGIPLPITETIYKILYSNLKPLDAVKGLMQREVKDETL